MINPDDPKAVFVARYHAFMRILLVEPSVKLVGRTLADYADFKDGDDCFPSNERLERDTGLGDKTIRNAMAFLRAVGAARRVETAVSHRRKADKYELVIPNNWKNMAVTGPNNYKFTCVWCGNLFNPDGGGSVSAGGHAQWRLYKSAFCPSPRKEKGRLDVCCNVEWNRSQRKAGQAAWGADNEEAWALFRQARGDDWD